MPDSKTPLKISYLELPADDMGATQRFYGTLFGWTFQDWDRPTRPSMAAASKPASRLTTRTRAEPALR